MEKRIGVIAVLVIDNSVVGRLNEVISSHGDIILGRQGMPLRDKGINIISLIVEGTTDQIGALTGKIGRLPRAHVKSVLTNYKESGNAHDFESS